MINFFSVLFTLCFIPLLSWGLCVKTDSANLRSGPGVKYEKTWKVYKYMPFKKLKRKGNWYKVRDFEGYEHWIHRKLVTNKFLCAVVKAEKANLRTGPGVTYRKSSVWPTAPQLASFKYLKTKGRYTKIKDSDGVKYWAFRSLLWVH